MLLESSYLLRLLQTVSPLTVPQASLGFDDLNGSEEYWLAVL